VAADPRHSIDAFISRLEGIVRSQPHDVMLAGTDASLLAISSRRDRLSQHVELGLPSHEDIQRAFDRRQIAHAATKAGLTTPEWRGCEGVPEAVEAAEYFGCPVLVKPMHTVLELDGAARRWASVIAEDTEAVRKAARSFGRCVVQRRVSGSVLSFGGVATAEGLMASVVSRYVRTWPVKGGNVSFSETIDPPAQLAHRVEALVAELKWRGVFELELIAYDGEFYSIDFNPRAYGSLSLAVSAGAPLPALWCAWLLGGRLEPLGGRVGARYRWEDADLRHFAHCVANRELRSALTVITPRREVTHAYFRLNDPIPAFARAIQLVTLTRRRLQDRLRR
jgi:predicted ATP-grasp superfamily ATP-dependent carboligase